MKIFNKHHVIAFGIAALNMHYSCVYAEEKTVIISKDMNIHIPFAQYNSKNFWLDLNFAGRDASGNLIWKLGNYGVNSDQAISCQDAKEKNLLNQDGNKGDGVYAIKLNNSSLNVYCDMTTDGGGWTLIFRHDVNGGYFSGSGEASNKNQDNPSLSTQKYSILNQLHLFKKDSRFKFRLNWPGYAEKNIWYQGSNPTENVNVSGYQAISVVSTSNLWGGLELGNGSHGPTNKASSYIDGSVNHGNWYYAIGSYKEWNGGMPASSIIGGASIGVKKVELWVQ